MALTDIAATVKLQASEMKVNHIRRLSLDVHHRPVSLCVEGCVIFGRHVYNFVLDGTTTQTAMVP